MSMILQITAILNVIGTILEARGQDDLGEYAKLAATLLEQGDNANDELASLTAEITAMVQEGRNPTVSEIETVRARRAALSAAIQNPGGTDPT